MDGIEYDVEISTEQAHASLLPWLVFFFYDILLFFVFVFRFICVLCCLAAVVFSTAASFVLVSQLSDVKSVSFLF